MPLAENNLAPALAFVNGSLWADIKRCLLEEHNPEAADAGDAVHTAAAKGFERKGFELAIKAIEKMPREVAAPEKSPYDRPAITNTAD